MLVSSLQLHFDYSAVSQSNITAHFSVVYRNDVFSTTRLTNVIRSVICFAVVCLLQESSESLALIALFLFEVTKTH